MHKRHKKTFFKADLTAKLLQGIKISSYYRSLQNKDAANIANDKVTRVWHVFIKFTFLDEKF